MSEENEHDEGTTTLEGIEKSLGELLQAADATDMLSKAYGGTAVDSYGHVDERGKTSGGYADGGEMGGLDSMMIGKMQQALVEQGFSADQIAAFMRGKQSDDEDEDEEDEESAAMSGKPAATGGGVGTNPRVKPSESSSMNTSMGGPYGKSMDMYKSDPDIAEAVDVSPYLEAMTAKTAEQLDALNKSIGQQSAKQNKMNKAQAVAIYNVGQLAKSIASVCAALDERLGLLEQQPNPQKGHTQLTGAQPMHKSMPNEAGGGGQGQPLQKSQVLSTLSYMNLEKGIKEIGGHPTSQIVGLYEAGGQLPQQALDAAYGFLQAHPHEAETALTYR